MIPTREEWLIQASEELRGEFDMIALNCPGAIPPKEIRVSCGWPSRKGTARKNRRTGECWPFDVTPDGVPQLFISPVLNEPLAVLSTLVHEIGHAYFGTKTGHRRRWQDLMGKIGYQYPANVAGEALTERLNVLAGALGPYPHEPLTPRDSARTQTTRLRLWECECAPPVKVRVASDTFEAKCLRCGAEFTQ